MGTDLLKDGLTISITSDIELACGPALRRLSHESRRVGRGVRRVQGPKRSAWK